MDPNATLNEIRELTARVLDGPRSVVERANTVDRLAELVEALDDWITDGGFLPRSWDPAFNAKVRP